MDFMDSVVDIIRSSRFTKQKYDTCDLDIEELRHPFSPLRNSFDCDECEEIELSEAHAKTTSALGDECDGRWSSLDDIFKNLRVQEDYPTELPADIKSCLKEMIFKPDLNIKFRENLGRKFSSSSGKRIKSDWKSNINKGDIRDAKTERKLSLLFSTQRKRSSINENVRKKIEENIFKIGKRRDADEIEDRKCSSDGRIKRKGTDGSVAISRKPSSVSRKLENLPSKKLELNVDEFSLSSSHYDLFKDVTQQQISKNSIPWSVKERTRIKVTHWLNK